MQGVGEQPSDIRQLLSVRWEQVGMLNELELPPTSAEELPVWLADDVPFLLADEPPF